MAIGRPTVASDLEQIGELLDDGETAILTVPGDVSSLVEGLTKMLDLPDLGQSIGRAARERARELHTWERRVQDILDALSGDQPNVANGTPH